MPFPRIRIIFSKINGFLKIYRNPQNIVAPQKSRTNTYQKLQIKDNIRYTRQMNIAMIVDEFTYNSFRFECNALPLEPTNWRETFESNNIDIFFCESAFSGVDSIKRPWKGRIYASINFPNENRGILLEILTYCKNNKIPTVFWNKEDPAHYEDRVHDFVKTALLFDHIFTTSSECVERYKREYGHNSVFLLMFATQPRLFNPIEKFERTDEIIFAGSWYRQHTERSEEMEKIIDSIIQSSYPLKIYDRQSNNDDPNHIFPEKYKSCIHPRLPHDSLDIAYKSSKYALNINTVTDSDTMFARRVFELMSSNTLVLSNYSKGMEQLFDTGVVFLDGKSIPDLDLESEKRDKCLYMVLSYHTYQRRFEQILRNVGILYNKAQKNIAIIYQVSNCLEVDKFITHYNRINWPNKHCFIFLNETFPLYEIQDIVTKYNRGKITVHTSHYNNLYKIDTIKYNDYEYYITATYELEYLFIFKALLHYSYLDSHTAIIQTSNINEKYKFTNSKPKNNMLIHTELHNTDDLLIVYNI